MVHFVGAGPGAPDLITRRGAALLQEADCIIYAGSLVNPALLAQASLPICIKEAFFAFVAVNCLGYAIKGWWGKKLPAWERLLLAALVLLLLTPSTIAEIAATVVYFILFFKHKKDKAVLKAAA